MITALTNGRIFTGSEIIADRCVLIDDSRIVTITTTEQLPNDYEIYDLRNALLVPGFIDTQVNGGGGHLFNNAPTVQTIREIGLAHQAYGTTGFLPTLISDELKIIEQGIRAVDAAIDEGVPGVLGIHIEGPFLSTDRKGVHDPQKFQRLEKDHIALLTSLKRGKTLITLAPEQTTPELISLLTSKGIIVAAGHTNATYEMTSKAIDAGVTGFTHLFNAMSSITGREPGVVGAALEDQQSWCGIIVDGHHVAPTSLKIALRCKPAEKFMLVTDAMPTVGMTTKTFTLQGREISVQNGVCISENGTLAGSDLNMSQAIRNTVSILDVDQKSAINMATCNPAAFLGLDAEIGRIAPGYRANLVALDADFEVIESWVDGKVFNKESPSEYPAKHTSQLGMTRRTSS